MIKMLDPMLEDPRESECPLTLPRSAELVDGIRSSIFSFFISLASDTVHSQHITIVIDLFLFLYHVY